MTYCLSPLKGPHTVIWWYIPVKIKFICNCKANSEVHVTTIPE